MVEAIEDLFVPVLVYNNKSSDAALLKKFNEPSWNNPIVRFLKSDGQDLIKRESGVWTVGPVASRMVAALKAANQQVPSYLSGLAIDQTSLESATFAMHCYWTGEARLGSIDGVMSTVSGWAGGLEVVQLTYDPKLVEYSKLVSAAQSFKCATKVFAHTDSQLATAKSLVGTRAVKFPGSASKAKLSDQKYQLRTSKGVRSLPLTTYQSTKINSLVRSPQRAELLKLLSPRQLVLLGQISEGFKSGKGDAIDRLVFPEDDAKLASYQAKLVSSLAANSPSSTAGSGSSAGGSSSSSAGSSSR